VRAARYGDILGMLAMSITGLWRDYRDDSMLELMVPVHQAALHWLADGHPLRDVLSVDLTGAYFGDRLQRLGGQDFRQFSVMPHGASPKLLGCNAYSILAMHTQF